MRIAYLDVASTGASGDKLLGALLDAGFPAADLTSLPEALGLAPEVAVEVARESRGGVAGMAVRVSAREPQPERAWRDVRALIADAALPEPVRERALAAFGELAAAEAAAHGTSAEDAHFHEVGAADSLVDVVGTCAGVHALGIERLQCSAIAVGSGTMRCAHGELPVPAPATARLLEGLPVRAGDAGGELTTPTGAALLRVLVATFGELPPMTLRAVGCGLGSRELGVPNVARLLLGDEAPEGGDHAALLETNVDHLTAEHVAYAAARLREAGAIDVWQTPAAMKKGRLGAVLSVLARPEEAAALAELLVRETGTLGVRVSTPARLVEPRAALTVATPLGDVRVKVGAGRVRPENDDVEAVARRTGMPYDEAARTLAEEARRALGRAADPEPE